MHFAPVCTRIGKKLAISMITMGLTLAFFFGVSLALAQDEGAPEPSCESFSEEEECLAGGDELDCQWTEEGACTAMAEEPVSLDLKEPSTKALLRVREPGADENWRPDVLQTLGLKFLIRGKEALAWALNIDDPGFHNKAIQGGYLKVLTIVNSLFILGLLVIAAMWMFSIFISRPTLRRVILFYAAAVIFVNFALPINQLFIDSTNLLQKTFLTNDDGAIDILDMVETPAYSDVIGYENKDQTTLQSSDRSLQLRLSEDPTLTDIPVGRVQPDPLADPLRATGDLSGPAGGNINLELSTPNDQILTVNREQNLTVSTTESFKPYREQSVFAFVLMILTGLGYLGLALIFILRIVILWALLIVSPILFLLAIFETTRGWFFSLLSLYGRWLLVGPLAALGISVVVEIWQSIGLPIQSSYAGGAFSGMTNALIYLPGSTAPNTLSNTGDMMQYLVFLMMLYLPLFFAFALTRPSMWRGAVTATAERLRGREEHRPAPAPGRTETKESRTTEVKEEKRGGWVSNVKDLVSTQISRLTETAMPLPPREGQAGRAFAVPSAASFLPEQLKLTGLHDMLGLIGVTPESRHSRDNAITQLAMPSRIEDRKTREHLMAVRSEVERRASENQPEATLLMNEIHSREATLQEKETVTERTVERGGEAPEIHVEAKMTPEEPAKTDTAKPSGDAVGTQHVAAKVEADENEDEEEGDEEKEDESAEEDEKKKNDQQKQ